MNIIIRGMGGSLLIGQVRPDFIAFLLKISLNQFIEVFFIFYNRYYFLHLHLTPCFHCIKFSLGNP